MRVDLGIAGIVYRIGVERTGGWCGIGAELKIASYKR